MSGYGTAPAAPVSSDSGAYLKRQLIAYIGNKRRLLGFLGDVLDKIGSNRRISTFADLFSGSGAVSRLARSRGYTVLANDVEDYAYVATAAYLETRAGELDSLFADHGGVRESISTLNAIGEAARSQKPPRSDAEIRRDRSAEGAYIAAHFAPRETERANYRSERLFYTAENARFIDAVRNEIETWYPAELTFAPEGRAKRLLIALLLYEASNHANTSGVFKAYHKGFGGHGRDALGRIMAPMQLEIPAGSEGPIGSAARGPALRAAGGISADIAYLDPPYATHQYGSNYFMLNSIVRWDRPTPPAGRAGIRPDWRRTRSPFCSRNSASEAFSELLEAIDAPVVVTSYSSDGLLSPEALYDLLAAHGRVELLATDYATYRGGRQSLSRKTRNFEYVMVMTREARSSSGDRKRLEIELLARRIEQLLASRFVPERIAMEFDPGGAVSPERPLPLADGDAPLATFVGGYEVACVNGELRNCPPSMLRSIEARLNRARCRDHLEEIEVLATLLPQSTGAVFTERQRRLLWCMRKFAFARYRSELVQAAATVDRLVAGDRVRYSRLGCGAKEILARAELRARG